MNRNITISMDNEVLAKARVLAAQQGLSVSALLRQEIMRLSEEDGAFTTAREEARQRLHRETRLGGGPRPTREEINDREALR